MTADGVENFEIAGGHRPPLQSENVLHGKLHDPGIEGASNLTEGVAGQAQSQ